MGTWLISSCNLSRLSEVWWLGVGGMEGGKEGGEEEYDPCTKVGPKQFLEENPHARTISH